MNRLTSQEKTVLAVVFTLLLLGLAVKSYRTAHPPVDAQKSADSLTPSGKQAKN